MVISQQNDPRPSLPATVARAKPALVLRKFSFTVCAPRHAQSQCAQRTVHPGREAAFLRNKNRPCDRAQEHFHRGARPRGDDGPSGPCMHESDGWGVWGLAPSRGAGRSPAKKILASFGGLEAISVRKRHYQFGKPRPPNWAIFLLNILLLTQNQKKRASAL